MLEQYVAAKRQVGEALLLFRMGDFFELFFEDAEVAARELELTLTARDKGDDPIPMAGVPHHAIDSYVQKLVARGYCVALCDQVEDPREAKGIVRREITRLITPGTLSELDALEPSRHTYLAAAAPIFSEGDQAGGVVLALFDMLSGELLVTSVADNRALIDELLRMNVRELLVDPDLFARSDDAAEALATCLGRHGVRLSAWPSGEVLNASDGALVPRAPPASSAVEAAWQQALTAIVRYAEHTQRRTFTHLETPRAYQLSEALVLDASTRRSLELTHTQMDGQKSGSLLAHLDCTTTALGARLLARWLLMPLRQARPIGRRADAVAQLVADKTARQALRSALREVYDIERLCGRVALERATPRDLFALARSLTQLPKIREILCEFPEDGLLGAWRTLDLLEPLAKKLSAALCELPPTTHTEGHIFARGFCAELDELIALCDDNQQQLEALEAEEKRTSGIQNLKIRYNRVFGFFIEVTRAQAKQVPAHYTRRQTLVNAERFVTPLLTEFEQKSLGAKQQRIAREAQLFLSLRDDVRFVLVKLKAIAQAIAKCDALASLAEVADRERYVRPVLEDRPVLDLRGSRHPVIAAQMRHGEPFVPNDIYLDADKEQVLLLTGPNMAGKSTVMRQAALAVVMAQMGGFVAASSATIGLCDRLFTRVGAQDHLSAGQSTFMVEMSETAAILATATPKSLILLDEVGRGTSTYDGVSLAWAIAEYLHEVIGARTLFATHYHELTALASRFGRIVNARMAIAESHDGITFLRQLERGAAQRSYGIEVARLANLPAAVLVRARELLGAYEQQNMPATSIAQRPEPPRAQALEIPPKHKEIIDVLRRTCLDSTTPIEAHALLAQLQNELLASPKSPRRRSLSLRHSQQQLALLPLDTPPH